MFEERPVGDLRGKRHAHILEQTYAYCEGGITENEFLSIASQLAACEELFGPDRVCVLFGYGSQPRRTYGKLRQSASTYVLWEGPAMPLWAYPLSYLVSAQSGLVVVRNGSAMEKALVMLAGLAMVELYSFSSALSSRVVTHVRSRRWRSEVGKVIGTDPGYYCFGLDGDWATYPAWFSYGPECPPRLKMLIPSEQEASGRENTESAV